MGKENIQIQHIEHGLLRENLPHVSQRERLIQPFNYGETELLEDFRRVIDERPVYPGYPQQGLTMSESGYEVWMKSKRRAEILVGLPNLRPRYFVERLGHPYDQLRKLVVSHDASTASDGSPLHPYLGYILTHTKRGLPTGPGRYWGLGKNGTVDSVFFRENQQYLEVLLVLRWDMKIWAFPGGYKNKLVKENSVFGILEKSLDAAQREFGEETGITDLEDIPSKEILRDMIVADPRTTAQAWSETTVYMFTPNVETGLRMVPHAGDDALDAAWFNVAGGAKWAGARSNDLFASHSSLLRLAIQDWQRETGKVVRFDGRIGRPKPNETMFDSVLPQLREKIYSISQSLMRRNG